ncbi:oxygenase [Devosia sp. Root685]|uniref:PDR/VanB family oxidoreductase n=1 Tax=Devosia sp. Root685 TaxID=1736587 RepID=UPI000701E64A|nr:PDR/VanB family oxidoreductase [Devosia sp. Root685]KRA95014.1 oxygenase [Devosia sp. Root685]
MRNRQDWRRGVVTRAEGIADDVRLLEFSVDGTLPLFDPGSHSNFRVSLGEGQAVRTYSCLPAQAGHISVAVKRHDHSRGGSRFMWGLEPGTTIELSVPENRFELGWRAPYYLLMAGGIGITPIYGMALALQRRGLPFRLVYGGRSRRVMAFADALEAELGHSVAIHAGEAGERIDIAGEIAALPANGELYVCGPIGMLNEVKEAWSAAGRPMGRLRYEVFGDSGLFAEGPFSVEVQGLGRSVAVRPDQTLLEALLGAGVDMIYDCQRGECGLCAVDIIEHDGPIDHRDVFFSAEEKQEGTRMCACVSRLARGKAVIDVGFRA